MGKFGSPSGTCSMPSLLAKLLNIKCVRETETERETEREREKERESYSSHYLVLNNRK